MPHVRVIMGQRIFHFKSSSRGSNKGPPRSGRTLVRPPAAALEVEKAMKEGHEETLEGPGEASRRPWEGPGETQKKKSRRRGSGPGPLVFEPSVVTARPRRREPTRGTEGGRAGWRCHIYIYIIYIYIYIYRAKQIDVFFGTLVWGYVSSSVKQVTRREAQSPKGASSKLNRLMR